MIDAEFVAKRMKQLRKEKGFKQADVARYMGIGETMYSLLESGKRVANLNHVITFCEYMNIAVSLFFEEDEGIEPCESSTEWKIVQRLNILSEEEKQAVLEYIDDFLN